MADSAAGVPAITSKRLWVLLLAVGAPIWIVAAVITGVTDDTILLPSVVLLGSFLVPITMVVFALSRPRTNHLTVEVVLLGFLGGGTLGLCFAALTEVYILPTAYGTFFGVGFIEESATTTTGAAGATATATSADSPRTRTAAGTAAPPRPPASPASRSPSNGCAARSASTFPLPTTSAAAPPTAVPSG